MSDIFPTDFDPRKSAQNIDDKRIAESIGNVAQLLSAAMWIEADEYALKCKFPIPLRKDHTWSIWVRETSENYTWAFYYLEEMCRIYKQVSNREHSVEQHLENFRAGVDFLPGGQLTEFINMAKNKQMGCDFRMYEPIIAYQKFLVYIWARSQGLKYFRGRGLPEWAKPFENIIDFKE